MISVTKLLTGEANYGDSLRYKPDSYRQIQGTTGGMGPVVVWNITKSCNLKCIHCYANAVCGSNSNELSLDEAKAFIDDLEKLKTPVLLISGGEPLLRENIFEIIKYANLKGIRCTLSTNGTLIDSEVAKKIKEHKVSYVGISLDGIKDVNDKFRGSEGAFQKALDGIRNCLLIGQKVGLRFTISKYTYPCLEAIFDLIETEKIPRVCFYHLVYSGRGFDIKNTDISKEDTRKAVDLIISKTLEFHRKKLGIEVLTVDNHADGVYIYEWAKINVPDRADEVLSLLKRNGGNRSGIAIGSVDWEGNVYIDQFTRNIVIGNIRDRKFSEIWSDKDNELLSKIRNRKKLILGRCKECKWIDLCNGNFRARATVLGDFWESDPACYLTDEEIGL